MNPLLITPKNKTREMFNDIAKRYDFLNHFLSFGIDKYWRRRVVGVLRKAKPLKILDIATGTGDMAIKMAEISPEHITGIDIAETMLVQARKKVSIRKLSSMIDFQTADSEKIPFSDNTFDAVTVAFGVRNFEHLEKGMDEILRVLKKNGMAVILEFSLPKHFPFRQLYKFYFRIILPFIGKLISKHQYAYRYLPDSVTAFPSKEDFIKILQTTGFHHIEYISLTFGIATIYIGKK